MSAMPVTADTAASVSLAAAGVTVTTTVPRQRRLRSVTALTCADTALVDRIRALLQVARPSASWWVEVLARLDDLDDRIRAHRVAVEGPGGLHEQLRADAPRVTAQISRLERDHDDIDRRLRETRALVSQHAGDLRRAPQVITAVADLLDQIQRHQRRGREVMHQAYQVDLGGE